MEKALLALGAAAHQGGAVWVRVANRDCGRLAADEGT
jgi:hypothetical protein